MVKKIVKEKPRNPWNSFAQECTQLANDLVGAMIPSTGENGQIEASEGATSGNPPPNKGSPFSLTFFKP